MIQELKKALYTPEDLLTMPDGDRYELVNGQLVERHTMGLNAASVIAELCFRVGSYSHPRKLGQLYTSEASYQCFPDEPRKVRMPDLSFICKARLPAGTEREGHCHIAPDWAIEVVSPNDLFYEVEEKVDEYISAGVRLVWVVSPPTRRVHIYRLNGSSTILSSKDVLDGEDVLPGFRLPVADLFAPLDEPGSDNGSAP